MKFVCVCTRSGEDATDAGPLLFPQGSLVSGWAFPTLLKAACAIARVRCSQLPSGQVLPSSLLSFQCTVPAASSWGLFPYLELNQCIKKYFLK